MKNLALQDFVWMEASTVIAIDLALFREWSLSCRHRASGERGEKKGRGECNDVPNRTLSSLPSGSALLSPVSQSARKVARCEVKDLKGSHAAILRHAGPWVARCNWNPYVKRYTVAPTQNPDTSHATTLWPSCHFVDQMAV